MGTSPTNLSAPPKSRATGHKSRHVAELSNVPLLGRSAWMSRIQQVATEAPPDATFPRLMAFLQFWKWLLPYLRDCIHRNARYRTYQDGQTGIFRLDPPENGSQRIGVAADWGTGTMEAQTVAQNILACNPHYTLHLGDLYYMGESGEIAENCLGQPRGGYRGVRWPIGSLGSFALMGNHEMYSGGQGYFDSFLTALGLLNSARTIRSPQSASFFCLEAEHWLIFGLDTGYHSGGMPAFTFLPGINAVPFLNVNARFDDKMLAWLRKTIASLQAASPTRKGVVVLTHHQPTSSFEHAFDKPARQLSGLPFFRGQEFVWLYGHEHRLTLYKQQTIVECISVHPRCIGHGGMPVGVTNLSKPDPNVLYYDPRQHAIDEEDPDTKVGYNGHVVLIFENAKLTIEYRDIVNNNLLLSEAFTPTGTGALQYSNFKPPESPLISGERTS